MMNGSSQNRSERNQQQNARKYGPRASGEAWAVAFLRDLVEIPPCALEDSACTPGPGCHLYGGTVNGFPILHNADFVPTKP